MSDDPNTPATPEPAEAAKQSPVTPVEQSVPAADPSPRPTPTIGAAEATWNRPAGSAVPDGTPAPVDPHPEKLVGAAFAGGLVAAIFLKGLAKRRHR